MRLSQVLSWATACRVALSCGRVERQRLFDRGNPLVGISAGVDERPHVVGELTGHADDGLSGRQVLVELQRIGDLRVPGDAVRNRADIHRFQIGRQRLERLQTEKVHVGFCLQQLQVLAAGHLRRAFGTDDDERPFRAPSEHFAKESRVEVPGTTREMQPIIGRRIDAMSGATTVSGASAFAK